MMYPTVDWPSDEHFWDILEHQLDRRQCSYVSLAIRTDPPASDKADRVHRLFSALTRHPIAKQLRFVNPLSVRDEILHASAATERDELLELRGEQLRAR